jgi:hypothetical protein
LFSPLSEVQFAGYPERNFCEGIDLAALFGLGKRNGQCKEKREISDQYLFHCL